jgi:hypothetical protein
MKTALYHQAKRPTRELVVIKTHADGAVDLAPGEGFSALLLRVPVSSGPKDGHATLVPDAAEAAAAEAKAAEAAAAEAAEAKAEAKTKAKGK